MYNIIQEASGEVPKLYVENFYEVDNDFRPKVEFSVCYNDKGFHAHFETFESNPKAVFTKHFEPVNKDSCVEWFATFAPELSKWYFNFEVNSIGIMNVSFRADRYEKIDLSEDDVLSLNIKTQIFEDRWTVDYTVPFALIKKYIPGYEFKTGTSILANVYKCGDETEFPHFGCWSPIDPNRRDFHRPELFMKMNIL